MVQIIDHINLLVTVAEITTPEFHKNILKSILILYNHRLIAKTAEGARNISYAQVASRTDAGTARRRPQRQPVIRVVPNTSSRKSLDEVAQFLPVSIRNDFIQIYRLITMDKPHHSERSGCPISTSLNKRESIRTQSSPLSPQHNSLKSPRLCLKRAAPTTFVINATRTELANADRHYPSRLCHITNRSCPNPTAPSCRNRTCGHPEVQGRSYGHTQSYTTFNVNPNATQFLVSPPGPKVDLGGFTQ